MVKRLYQSIVIANVTVIIILNYLKIQVPTYIFLFSVNLKEAWGIKRNIDTLPGICQMPNMLNLTVLNPDVGPVGVLRGFKFFIFVKMITQTWLREHMTVRTSHNFIMTFGISVVNLSCEIIFLSRPIITFIWFREPIILYFKELHLMWVYFIYLDSLIHRLTERSSTGDWREPNPCPNPSN